MTKEEIKTDFHNWIFDTIGWDDLVSEMQSSFGHYDEDEAAYLVARDCYDNHPELANPEFDLTEEERIDVLVSNGL